MYYLISVDIDTLIVRESDEVIGDLENIEVGNDVKIIYKGKQLEVPVEAISENLEYIAAMKSDMEKQRKVDKKQGKTPNDKMDDSRKRGASTPADASSGSRPIREKKSKKIFSPSDNQNSKQKPVKQGKEGKRNDKKKNKKNDSSQGNENDGNQEHKGKDDRLNVEDSDNDGKTRKKDALDLSLILSSPDEDSDIDVTDAEDENVIAEERNSTGGDTREKLKAEDTQGKGKTKASAEKENKEPEEDEENLNFDFDGIEKELCDEEQLWGKNHPEGLKMIFLAKDIYATKESLQDVAKTKTPESGVAKLVPGVFKTEYILKGTVSGDAKKGSEEKVFQLHYVALDVIIKYIVALHPRMVEREQWRPMTKEEFSNLKKKLYDKVRSYVSEEKFKAAGGRKKK